MGNDSGDVSATSPSRPDEALDTGRGKQVTGVVGRCLFAMVVGLVLIVSGCTATQSTSPPPPAAPPPSNEVGPLPAEDCADRITESDQASAAVAQVRPGSTVCLSGDGVTDAELEVTISGTRQQSITIIGDGATMRSMNVKADYVVIQGLTLRDGDGLTMTGRGLVARDNVIYNAAKDGLVCQGCIDTIIESNTVQRADGTGIYLAGQRIMVRDNMVSESVARTQNDADGIRFFGSGHRLIGNTIKDIKRPATTTRACTPIASRHTIRTRHHPPMTSSSPTTSARTSMSSA